MLHDGKAEPEPAVGACSGGILLPEWLKDMRQECRRDPSSSVRHHDLDMRVFSLHSEVDPAALRGEFHRVRQQIPDHLLKTVRVAIQRPCIRIEEDLQPYVFRVRGWSNHID